METSLDGKEATNTIEHHSPDDAVKEESNIVSSATQDKVKLTVVQFAEEDPILKWFLRIMSVMLIVCLIFLWIYYR